MVIKKLIEQMDKLEDLLPGIEEFLCSVLAKESLTQEAEEQRQYFVERLDIIKLPPSVPPRPQSLGLQLYPISDGSLPTHSSSNDSVPDQDDFAAHQRELSRALVAKGNTSQGDGEAEEVKVYDDIEPKDDSAHDGSPHQLEDEDSMYEIPQIKRNLSDSGYEKAFDADSLSKNYDTAIPEENSPTPAVPQPPPLPPRRERTGSDAASRCSVGSTLEDKLPGSGLKLEQQLSTPSFEEKETGSRSEKSSDDVLEDHTGDEVDAASVDSMDPDGGVKLPKAMKKKRYHHKVSHSLSAPLCDIFNAFCDLEDVTLSGELYYKNTLLSTKNMVALSNNNLICYRHDKMDCKPVLVIPLTGYRATFHKRSNSRQSYEIQLFHDELEDHSFLTDLKQWAQTWCEYINCVAEGRKVTGPYYSLVKNRSMEPTFGSTYDLTKSSSQMFGSSTSVCSVDGLETGTGKIKKRNSSGSRQRLGSIVSRASHLLDNFKLLKKSTSTSDQANIPEDSDQTAKDSSNTKERNNSVSDRNSNNKDRNSLSRDRTKIHSSSGDSVQEHGAVSEPTSPLTPDSNVFEPTVIQTPTKVPKTVKIQGYLNIYSSFNKRKWGKRWCKVLENNFECYRNQVSTVCELEFLLRSCILRRAIDETKSELGLMLLENNREKITVEPLSWNELGSWLRVLMHETSTPKAPEGLEGYMEEVNQYQDIAEETRDFDLDSAIDTQLSPGNEKTLTTLGSDDKNTDSGSWRNSYRDSGNCSAESVDGKSEPERTSLHPDFSDSSLPRVNIHTTGDIYTQVRKSSIVNKLESRKCVESDEKVIIPINKVPSSRDNHSADFGSTEDNLNALESEQSMMDEVLSKFTSQVGSGFDTDNNSELENKAINLNNSQPLGTEFQQSDDHQSENSCSETKRPSQNLTELDGISPIKESLETESSELSKHENFLCSSFVEHDQGNNLVSKDNSQVESKSDEYHADGVVITVTDDSLISDPDMKPSFTVLSKASSIDSAIDKTNGHENLKKSSPASDIHKRTERENVHHKKPDVCVEDLADVLSNLSLEDDASEDNVTNPSFESVKTDTDKVNAANENNSSKVSEKADEYPEASCDIVRRIPLDSELDSLDEDTRTRRSVVMREISEKGGDIERTLKELRTKLVQLKKDRISIHDRMQKASDSDMVYKYLQDEYNRLNREVEKVNEEIACLEQLQREKIIPEEKQPFDDDQEEIEV